MISLPPGLEMSAPSPRVIPTEHFIGTPPPAPTTPLVALTPDPSPVTIDDETRAAPPRRPRAKWRLVLPEGTEYTVTGTVVVGRQPSAKAFAGATDVLKVEDAEGLISKSHAVFELDGSTLWVRDLGSTNGVMIVAPDDSERTVSSTERSPLAEGDEVELGSFALRVARGSS
jgi:hypothetical protein